MSQGLLNENARIRLIALGVPQLRGGEGEEGQNGGNGDAGNGKTTSPASTGNDGDGDNDDDEETDPELEAALQRKLQGVADAKDRKLIKLSNENSKRRNELKRLNDQLIEAQAAKAELDEIKRRENSELQNASGDLEKATTKLQKLEGVLQKALLENAIRNEEAFTWHDISDVVAAIDKGTIQIDLEAGTIEGLAPELKRIAGEKPHYVKSKKSGKRSAPNDENGTGGVNGSSGVNPGGTGSPSNADAARRAALEEKYPVLRNVR